MSFETERRKLNGITQDENKNTIDGNQLRHQELRNKPETITKITRVIHLIQGYNFTFGKVAIPFDSRVTVIAGGPDQLGGGGLGG